MQKQPSKEEVRIVNQLTNQSKNYIDKVQKYIFNNGFNSKDVDLEVTIMSCGKYYRSLVLHTNHGKWADKPKWQCKSNKNYCNINTVGETPKEAVLNFYLRLRQSRLVK